MDGRYIRFGIQMSFVGTDSRRLRRFSETSNDDEGREGIASAPFLLPTRFSALPGPPGPPGLTSDVFLRRRDLRPLRVGVLRNLQQLLVIGRGFGLSPAASAARAAPYVPRKRFGSFFIVASNAASASLGCPASSSMKPSSSRAGASGPGVTADLSVASSASAAALSCAMPSSLWPCAKVCHASATRRWIRPARPSTRPGCSSLAAQLAQLRDVGGGCRRIAAARRANRAREVRHRLGVRRSRGTTL